MRAERKTCFAIVSVRAAAAATLLAALAGVPFPASARSLATDPDAGNNSLSAVFDAAIGERIIAVSSAVDCTLEVDDQKLVGKALCRVPLTSIEVDNEPTKTEHFQQWATNKKGTPQECTFDLVVDPVELEEPVAPSVPVAFETTGTFTICGRSKQGGGKEKITGTLVHLPAGMYGPRETLRIRARIDDFEREAYGISPAATPGWLARVQQLAPVVAGKGSIDVNIFARPPEEPAKP